MNKKCSICKEIKILSNFNKNKRNKDGLHSDCTKCKAKYSRKHKLRKIYNLTPEDYFKMTELQNNLCAICDRPERDKHRKILSVDHNHKTNKVRGLLCHKCNAAIGYLGEDISIILNAANYLFKYATRN